MRGVFDRVSEWRRRGGARRRRTQTPVRGAEGARAINCAVSRRSAQAARHVTPRRSRSNKMSRKLYVRKKLRMLWQEPARAAWYRRRWGTT